MKSLVAVISSLIFGLILAPPKISLFQDVQHLLANKKRILFTFGLFASGFVLLMSGILVGAIESAQQYDSQGFIVWNAMQVVASGLFVGAIILLFGASFAIPKRALPQPTLADTLHNLGIPKLIEDLLAQMQTKGEGHPQNSARPRNSERRFENDFQGH